MTFTPGRTAAMAALALGLLTYAAAADPNGGVVVVRTSDLAPYKAVEAAFSKNLNRAVVSLSVEKEPERVRQEARTAALVFAIGPEAARAVAAASPNGHVLYSLLPNPASISGEVAARTVPMFVPPSRQLNLIRRVLPAAKRLGIVFDQALSQRMVDDYVKAAAAAGVSVVRAPVSSRKEVAGAMRALIGRVDAVWLVPDATVVAVDTFKFMIQTSLREKLPLIGFSQAMSKAGALLSIEAEYGEIGESAASSARRLLSGGGGSPDEPEGALFLNGRTAELMNLEIPDSVRQRAQQVF